ncbi:hypothetical protein [Sphingopyxis sp. GW247-27LB]|uniref:hypothetical protein n=1 Tax=Sphingopyxis sp. GW247-27LB TaxID=2012632 RepID=UPI000BA79AC3|nr:hypothetical protein [Sphingopyxis sp. GW247-27LB]PAL23541.1 hypothetical protein CD928_05595 [Sphingopyxis sp. GW247-27LB]
MLLDYRPNWSRDVEVSISFKTEILSSRDGTEQRRALRANPRKQVSFTAMKYGADRQQQIFGTADAQRQEISLADPTRSVTCSAVADDDITLDSIPDWLVVGESVVLDRTVEVTVLSVVGSIVTVSDSVALPEPFDVRPALRGMLQSEISLSSRTSRLWEVPIQFDLTPGSELSYNYDADLFRHAGRQVWHADPNWGSNNSFGINQKRETIDFGHGATSHLFPVPYADRLQTWDFSPLRSGAVGYIEGLFNHCRGRAGEFMLPTFHEDATPLADLVAGDADILVEGTHLLGMETDWVHRYLLIALNDGRIWYRTVVDSVEDAGNTLLSVNRNFVETVAPDQVKHISLMSVARFASDELVSQWTTDDVASVRVNFLSLPVTVSEEDGMTLDPSAEFMLEFFGRENPAGHSDIVDILLNINWADTFDE